MKRTVLLIPLLVLLALPFATSSVAASVEKVPVTATQIGKPVSFLPETGINEGGILHIYATAAGNVPLYSVADGVIATFNSSSSLAAIINTKTGEGVIHYEMKWAKLTDIHDPTTEIGAFEGQVNGKIIDYTYAPTGYVDSTPFPAKFAWAGSVHVVFQGSGVFEGQTLMLDGTRERTGPVSFTGFMWEGSLLTH